MKENVAKALKETIKLSKLAKEIIAACEEAKGKDLTVLDVSKAFGLVDNFIIVSGRSDRQVQGITNRIIDAVEKSGQKPISVEGFEEGQWVLIDCADVVVHVFYEPVREHYDLESLWMNAQKVELKKPRRAKHAA
ncbi:MAG: ribosome silencing factor [Pseudomonadota bacterium]|jgi:ribosome-associated protein